MKKLNNYNKNNQKFNVLKKRDKKNKKKKKSNKHLDYFNNHKKPIIFILFIIVLIFSLLLAYFLTSYSNIDKTNNQTNNQSSNSSQSSNNPTSSDSNNFDQPEIYPSDLSNSIDESALNYNQDQFVTDFINAFLEYSTFSNNDNVYFDFDFNQNIINVKTIINGTTIYYYSYKLNKN